MFKKVSLISFVLFFSAGIVHGEITYEVKQGDTLSKIARAYGDLTHWYKIYKANQNKIEDPSLIYPGQKLTIPKQIAQNSGEATDDKKKKYSSNERASKKNSSELEKFRQAFNKVTKKEKQKSNSKTQSHTETNIGLGGMVLNETRSKMGSNFYSIFYKQWEAPKNAENYTIKISERPIPSRGTLIEIKINGQTVFKNRLAPRYYKTKQSALRAVYLCQKKLQQKLASQNEFKGY